MNEQSEELFKNFDSVWQRVTADSAARQSSAAPAVKSAKRRPPARRFEFRK